jgi:predicted nuclease of predicted toxin-antitoxin system
VTFLLDHDVPEAIARVIPPAGHGVIRLPEILPREADDVSIMAWAHAHNTVVVTCNRDHFLALARQRPHAGIVVLIRRSSRMAECSRFIKLLNLAGESGIRNNINFA